MLTPETADLALQRTISALPAVRRPLEEATGCVLRETISLHRDAPPFDRVTMDGYAISTRDWRNGRRRFHVVRQQAAGERPGSAIGSGECVEVMTGASLPPGADCVIPYEQVERAENEISPVLDKAPSAGDSVHLRGADARSGKIVLQPGCLLGSREIAVAASCGKRFLQVSPQVKITVAATGDELVEPGQPIKNHQVYASNGYALESALRRWGGADVQRRMFPDDAAVLRRAMKEALADSDALALSGGVSRGNRDFVARELIALGVREVFHGVAQKPGRPLWFGVTPDGKPVFGLPGNPLSTLVCAHRYLVPALEALRGAGVRRPQSLPLAEEVHFSPPLVWFLPVKEIVAGDGAAVASPRPPVNSGDYLSVLHSDGFLELPATHDLCPACLRLPFWRWL